MRFDIGTLDSGERSLPFGLLVKVIDLSYVLQVHSANSWESADLGDDERKKKFLKLMGASKVCMHMWRVQ